MTDIMECIAKILREADSPASVIRPTELYNEGWMLRLLLDWLCKQDQSSYPFTPVPGARWCSEALLRSPFLMRFANDPIAEGWTNADACVGHFRIAEGQGELLLDADAMQFAVIEAKMGSGLATGTTHAKKYDQAARNVACMAKVLEEAGRSPHEVPHLSFSVVAPAIQIERGVFKDFVTARHMLRTVEARAAEYDGTRDHWLEEWFRPTLGCVDLGLLSWEEVLQGTPHDYWGFYRRCLQYNGVGA